jgi:hypothetical protein
MNEEEFGKRSREIQVCLGGKMFHVPVLIYAKN